MNSSEIQQIILVSKEAECFQLYYSIYLYVLPALSLCPTVIFYVFFRDRLQRLSAEFRPLVIHVTCASSGLMLTIAIWQPVALPPLFGGYSLGLLSLLGDDGFLVGLWLTWTCMSHLGVTFALAFVLQSYQLKLFGEKKAFFEWLNSDGNSLKFLNIWAFAHALMMLVPSVTLHIYKIDLNGIPELYQLISDHPSVMLMHRNGNAVLVIFCVICLIAVVFELLCCLVSNIMIFKTIRSTSHFVQAKTLQMQMQLYRLFSFQLLIVALLFYLPTCLIVVHIYEMANFKIPNFVPGCICVMCWHCPVQMLISFWRFPMIRRSSVAVASSATRHKLEI